MTANRAKIRQGVATIRMLPYVVLGIQEGTPQEQARKAYKRAAHTYHPDLGGTEQAMKRINSLWEEVCQRKGWKP